MDGVKRSTTSQYIARRYITTDIPASAPAAAHGACSAEKLPMPSEGQLKELAKLEDAISIEVVHAWAQMNLTSGNLSIKAFRVKTGHRMNSLSDVLEQAVVTICCRPISHVTNVA